MIPVGPVTVRRRLDASRERVWFALADADIRAAWWPDLSFELVSGGALREFWAEEDLSRDASGKIDVLVAGHALGFAWSESGDRTQTRVLISLVSDSGGNHPDRRRDRFRRLSGRSPPGPGLARGLGGAPRRPTGRAGGGGRLGARAVRGIPEPHSGSVAHSC